MPPSKGTVLALVALTLGTLVVRLMGYDFGVPLMKEADTFVVEHVRMLNEGEVKIDRAQSALQYPSLLAEFVALFSDRTLEPTGAERSLQEHLNSAASLWLQVRLVVALASVLIVPGTFFLARRFVGDAWALFAAALMSFSLLHVFFAQQARCHALAASLAVWAIVACLWMRRSPSWRSYLAVAALVALTAGAFHSGLAVLAPLAVAQLLRKDKRWFDARILLAFALTAASVRVFYWYYFDEAAQAAKGENDGTLEAFSQGMFDGSGFARLARTAWYYEPALTLLVLLALAALAITRGRRAIGEKPVEGRDVLVVASYVTPYLLLAGYFSATYERFLLPLLPHFAVFAAWGLSTLVARLESRTAKRALAGFGLALLALPAAASTKLSWLRSTTTTIDEATAWLRLNVSDPANEPIYALPPLDFALFRTPESLRYPAGRAAFFTPWTIYQNRLADEARIEPLYRIYWLSAKEEHRQLETADQVEAYLRSHGAGLFVVERIHANQSLGRSRIAETLSERGRRLARFSPDEDSEFTNHKLWDQDVEAPGWPHVTWRVLRARAVGPILEIYELP
jgi:hypothetical protein